MKNQNVSPYLAVKINKLYWDLEIASVSIGYMCVQCSSSINDLMLCAIYLVNNDTSSA